MHRPSLYTSHWFSAKSELQHSIACNSNNEHNSLYPAILTGKQDDIDELRHRTAFWSRVVACTVNECIGKTWASPKYCWRRQHTPLTYYTTLFSAYCDWFTCAMTSRHLTSRQLHLVQQQVCKGGATIVRMGVQIVLREKRAENFLVVVPPHMPFWGYNSYKERHTESLSDSVATISYWSCSGINRPINKHSINQSIHVYFRHKSIAGPIQ